MGICQSPIPNPQSPIPNPQSPIKIIKINLNYYIINNSIKLIIYSCISHKIILILINSNSISYLLTLFIFIFFSLIPFPFLLSLRFSPIANMNMVHPQRVNTCLSLIREFIPLNIQLF